MWSTVADCREVVVVVQIPEVIRNQVLVSCQELFRKVWGKNTGLQIELWTSSHPASHKTGTRVVSSLSIWTGKGVRGVRGRVATCNRINRCVSWLPETLSRITNPNCRNWNPVFRLLVNPTNSSQTNFLFLLKTQFYNSSHVKMQITYSQRSRFTSPSPCLKTADFFLS